MRTLLLGVALIILVGIGGLIYRNVAQRPVAPTGACTLDARVCPDGTAVGRVAPACDFAPCPFPNVTLASANIIFELPSGYASTTLPDPAAIAAYTEGTASSSNEIIVHQYAVGSSTAESVIYATAISDQSQQPVAPSAFSAVTIGQNTYSFVILGRFEGTVHTAYYLPMGSTLLRFDAISQNVPNWADPNLNPSTLPTDQDLRTMLSSLQTSQ